MNGRTQKGPKCMCAYDVRTVVVSDFDGHDTKHEHARELVAQPGG